MYKLILIMTFSILCVSCDETKGVALTEEVHVAKQVGVSVLKGEKYPLVITKEGYLFIAEPGSPPMSQNFEFTISSAEPLSVDHSLIDDLGLTHYKNDKYLIQGIKVKYVLIQTKDKCYRINAQTKEQAPCDKSHD